MSTTNGTRAILAARSATTMYAAALVNARATAEALARQERDVTLLCSGTDGAVSVEDLIGAGAIIAELEPIRPTELVSDEARMARALFETHRSALPIILRQTSGGRNVIAAGLEADVDFASRVNEFNIVATIDGGTLTVKRAAIV